MNELWLEASNIIDVEIETDSDIGYLYLGYKITKNKETQTVTLYDIRVSDLYNEVQGELLDRFIANGFERTCDELQIERDSRRMKIADYYIMKAIVSGDEEKKNKLSEDRLKLLLKITKLKEKSYEK